MKNLPKGKMRKRFGRSPYNKYNKRPWEYSGALRAFINAVKGTGSVTLAREEHNAFLRVLRRGGI